MFRLEGRTALITGASRGIGEATARRLAAQGARVVLAARSLEPLERLAEELRADGGEALPLVMDLGSAESIEEAVGSLAAPFEAPDIVVHNAGMTADNVLARMKPEQWEDVLRVNLTGTFLLTRQLVRGMMKRRFGRIVIVSSVVGLMGNPGQANYAASKAGLMGFARSLAKELGSRGITVNVVAPGYVETDMTAGLDQAQQERLEDGIALGRLGAPDDIAPAIVYLASDEASYVTGEVLNVSGGLFIG